ncbi:MAG: hypothetical protein V4627_13255 [Pseudomonadota bacterium]
MHTPTPSCFRLTLTTAAFLFSAGAALAAGPSRETADAQERYRQEMAVCNSGQSHQDVKTCRTEARNALAEAKRGGLVDAAPNQFSRNAVQRCAEFQGDERTACEARVFNPSRVDGSVTGGGLLRESVIVVPVR